ncbi:MAG: DoxX family protein [Phycisphaerales bacterium]
MSQSTTASFDPSSNRSTSPESFARAADAAAPASPARHGRLATAGTWTLQLTAAAILGQTLFFKFTGAPEAVYIFETLGAEPFGRFFTGGMEAIAVLLLLIPRLSAAGAALTLGLMSGAIASHLGPLGIEVMEDGGALFAMSLLVAASAAGVLAIRRTLAIAQLRSLIQLATTRFRR